MCMLGHKSLKTSSSDELYPLHPSKLNFPWKKYRKILGKGSLTWYLADGTNFPDGFEDDWTGSERGRYWWKSTENPSDPSGIN